MKKLAMILAFLLLMGCAKAETLKYADIRSLADDYGSWDHRQEAVDDGVVVYSHQEVSNIEVLESFIENVSKGKSDSLRILYYTIEGNPIITDVSYERLKATGDRFAVTVDTTRDSFAGFGKLETSYWAYLGQLGDAANLSSLLPYASDNAQSLYDGSSHSPARYYSPDGRWMVEEQDTGKLTATCTDGSKRQLELDGSCQDVIFEDRDSVYITLDNDSRLCWALDTDTTNSVAADTELDVSVLASQSREQLDGDGWVGPGTSWWRVSESFTVTGSDGALTDIQYKYVLRLSFRNSETEENAVFYYNGCNGEYLGRA